MDDSPDGTLDAWGSWLADTWHWDWFHTGTFAPLDGETRKSVTHTAVGWDLSDRRFRQWVEQLQQLAGQPVYWVRARERHQFNRSTHFHSLIGGVGNLSRRDAWREWFERNGQARIEPVRGADEVARYVSKYVVKEYGSVEFSENAGAMKRYAERGFWYPSRTGALPVG